jgi:hypothetical protein
VTEAFGLALVNILPPSGRNFPPQRGVGSRDRRAAPDIGA